MTEQIGKVTLDTRFYQGGDSYSDGDIENDMLKIAMNYDRVEDLLKNDSRWPILYHFSPIRENILEWFPFGEGCEVLEIGAGCGAVTGAILKSGARVTAVELSKRRSMINAHRHRDMKNLKILVGNFSDIQFDGKYDYIVLIGVLEYARLYTVGARDPYVDFLARVKRLLKPGGRALIAIENKFGLKYWSGAREDHTGGLFDGIEGYPCNEEVSTFSKPELTRMIGDAGFSVQEYYYPYPDYKFPTTIYSDRYLPKIGDLWRKEDHFDYDALLLFDEKSVYDNLIRSDMFDFFSNSYLVVVG